MKTADLLRIQQLQDSLRPFTKAIDASVPAGGWLRALREALGMTSAQLAKRLGLRAPQSIQDIQRSETLGTVKLDTLRAAAEAMGCRLVYAIVPVKPLNELRRERAEELARQLLRQTAHSMALEDQALGQKEQERALAREIDKLLMGKQSRLWD